MIANLTHEYEESSTYLKHLICLQTQQVFINQLQESCQKKIRWEIKIEKIEKHKKRNEKKRNEKKKKQEDENKYKNERHN